MGQNEVRVPVDTLHAFVVDAFRRVGIPDDDARISADILLASDVRGIESHGVPRLRGYITRIRQGVINLRPTLRVLAETPATLALDADNGLGMPSAYRAMQRCIAKAQQTGFCLTTVRNSNHFGIAGYYATMALEAGLCGVAMTNATPLVVPAGARDPYLSTAPIAVAIPAGEEPPFVLDMATSTVAWGKIEIAQREGKPIPRGWAYDANGELTTDPFTAVALTPLGALPELGAHKGYGLGLFIEVLCGPLAGGPWGYHVAGSRSAPRPSGTGHAFMAWRIDAFQPEDQFRAAMDEMLRTLRSAAPRSGVARVLVPGDPEREAEADRRANGIPLHPKVLDDLRALAAELDLPAPF
ncbi:Ldh family oxidoreductase [Thermorudis peleae]|uniref:Ldh family oxidoreductase n=1 Tax=Thermorudis peleae TaxID=1382356 RepID=UPI0009DF1D31|nr:Ldh family oxidoreductase [Thermorudis peleae]